MTKPTIIFRHGGNPYDLYLITMAALRKDGLKDQVRELHKRSLDAQSFHEMLNLVLEYVDVDQG
jgi:hypothetical protein